MKSRTSALLLFILLMPAALAAPSPQALKVPRATERFHKLLDQYFDVRYRHHPTEATAAGFHQYDTRLEDYSQAAVRSEIRDLRRILARVEAFDPKLLQPVDAADREMAISLIHARLLELEDVRMWEKNPDAYAGSASYAVFVIMSRNYAPPAERLRAVIARLRRMPAVFQAARANLRNPPRIYTEIALQQLPGITGFFRDDVPKAFADVRDEVLLSQFRQANRQVIDALTSYEKFLREGLLPRSNGDFRIGAENFRKKLLYEEMIDIPLDRLREIGYADLRRNQQWFRKTAARIDASRPAPEVLAELGKDHPAPEGVLDAFRGTLAGLQEFITRKKIATIPSPVPPILQETPPFARALTFASMDTPGPFEENATESYFSVTLPDKSWTAKQVEDHMSFFNRNTIIATSVHEAYPGHYLQALWTGRAPSRFRKLLWTTGGFAGSNSEGWAHYAEQMMLDEGYGDNDPKLRLGQLQAALLRNCRFLVGLEMHTGTMTFDQGIDFFQNECHATRVNAERETKRGTADPTYLIYTLGKLQILDLREQYARKLGSAFNLGSFHDAFLAQGPVPLAVIRRALVGEEKDSAKQFPALVEDFIAAFFRMNPTPATVAGIHEHDGRIEDFSPAGIRAQIDELRSFERRFEQVAASTALESADRELALSFIRASVLRLESVRMWETNPDDYSSLASNTMFVLMSREFAPPEERIRPATARLRLIPQLLQQARANLKNPPRIHTETALLQLPGIIGFFENDVPAAFASVKDPRLTAGFRAANQQAIAALRDYEQFLRNDLLPRSHGDFRIGADLFRKKLLYEEMVETPLDRLLEIAYADLRRNQAAFAQTARQIDPARSPLDVLDDMERDHPKPGELLDAVRKTLGSLRDFVVQHQIITLPSDRKLRVEETPPFMRATSSASLDAPGAFEKHVNEAFYHVALPDPAATPEQIESHMRSFSYVGVVGTSIHEAYPGHFTQYLWQDQAPSKLRLFLATDFSTLGFGFAWTNVEGWAHYSEQMMLDEGYGRTGADPDLGFLRLRLSQLQDALLRNARFIVGIEMHTGKMTYEQGIDFFRREAYQPQVSAERETRRGTSDPTYLVYNLGKLEILKLREDYRKARGSQFSLRDFHDRFMQQGSVPIPVIRKALLGGTSAP
ncbi:MAG TPA: DUF885 domain-containing protein [Terriglobales bacterium]|nr:DUF885 domain-containing protein [Terriglobales bacterium]